MDIIQKVKENPTELFRLVNIAVGGFTFAGGVGNLIEHSFSSIIVGVYMLLAGAATAGLELRSPTEQQAALIQKYASFMNSFGGRGVFYILIGILMLNFHILLYITGTFVGVVGIVYFGLHFYPVLEPPSTMRPPSAEHEAESQPVWTAPQ